MLRNLLTRKRSGLWLSLLLFSVAFLVFTFSPVRSLGETQYTMMLGYTLLHHRTFVLDPNELRIPDHLEMIGDSAKVKGLPLEVVDGRVYKYAPPGSTVLSLPLLTVAGWFGLKPVDVNGTYDPIGELRLSGLGAALLMAIFAVICLHFANLILPLPWSFALALGATFGTQIWSTASRVVEPDTWTVVLMLSALFLLVASEVGKMKFRPILMASILSWCYFVHPTSAISIVGITLYVWLFQRRFFWYFAITGAGWLVLLLLYSWQNFGRLLPNYFQAGRLGFQTFWEALAGNLVSPSRGLLIFLPALLAIAFLVLHYRNNLRQHRLVVLAAAVVLAHLLVISGFEHWWAGHSYGPRYWTSMVPWFVLLAAFGLQGLLSVRKREFAWRLQVGILVLLASLGILIHARGALADETRRWNFKPYDIDLRAGRLWDWSYPQFLAGLVSPPLPAASYAQIPLGQTLDFTSEMAAPFLWYGWSDAEPNFRWSDGNQATVVFALDKIMDLTMVVHATPFVLNGVKESQRVLMRLNGEQIDSFTVKGTTDLRIVLPSQYLKRENVLLFDLPDADSPANLGLSTDSRLLGIAVQSMEFNLKG